MVRPRTMINALGLAAGLAVAACDARPTVVADRTRSTTVAIGPSVDAGVQPAQQTLSLERVAVSAIGRVFAIGSGELFRLDAAGHWDRVALEGADARDLVASRGAVWILARGVGGTAGRALVLRTTTGDDVRVVASPMLGPGSEPRALAVVQNDEFWIGGERPPLTHVTATRVDQPAAHEPVVRAVRAFRDEAVYAIHPDRRVTAFRWGERTSFELDEDYLDAITDADGAPFTVHTHGEVGRGRPGREFAMVASAAPFAPRVVALLGESRPVAVGAGGPFAVWEHHTWRTIPGDFPSEPIAILPGDPVRVVGRHGEIVEVHVGHGAAP